MRTKYPAGTTKEQWAEYETKKLQHEAYMEAIKPHEPIAEWYLDGDAYTRDYAEYTKKLSQWKMAYHCDAPNEPGYYRANND